MPAPEELLQERPVALQFTPLVPGEELVVLHTNHGDIILRLFPQAAPLAVENFKTHAANGFYNGLIFHRVMEGFMIQGGCSLGTGTGGESIWGMGFGPEHNYDLWHFHGALAAAQTSLAESIGSQFYIVHRSHIEGGFDREFQEILNHLDNVIYPEDWDGTSPHITLGDIYPREMLEHYLRVGGTPHLDFPFNTQPPNFGHTVFGHVVMGLDVVNSIAQTEVDGSHRPLRDAIINSVSFVVYEG
jgi:peptidyl-prolyl cis-trans isomerase B (cyclophilin B)